MTISVGYSIAIIAVCVVCTFLERALPFLLFGGREVPKIVKYLGRILPMAVMATLVVYCLRRSSSREAARPCSILSAGSWASANALWYFSMNTSSSLPPM